MIKVRLNDLQLVLLSGAAARSDGSLLPFPTTVSDPARARKAIEQLLKKNLAEEHPGATRENLWREDGDRKFRAHITDAGRSAINADETTGSSSDEDLPSASPPELAAPRLTKRAQLIGLLSREGGATLDELVTTLSWLPHTTRAAITDLRKAGMPVDSRKQGGVRSYYIIPAA